MCCEPQPQGCTGPRDSFSSRSPSSVPWTNVSGFLRAPSPCQPPSHSLPLTMSLTVSDSSRVRDRTRGICPVHHFDRTRHEPQTTDLMASAPARDHPPRDVTDFRLSISPGNTCRCAFCRGGFPSSWGGKRVTLRSPHTAAPLFSPVFPFGTCPPGPSCFSITRGQGRGGASPVHPPSASCPSSQTLRLQL